MTDEQMIKEIVERRRQWGETRDSDFDWLIEKVEKQQKVIENLRSVRYSEMSDIAKETFGID